MEHWDQDYIDLVEPGYINFDKKGIGAFLFGTVVGFIDYRISNENSQQTIEFSWEGTSEYDPVCGRGRFELRDINKLYGRLFIHNGDDSWLTVIRE